MITGPSLADVWPEVSTRLGRLLASRGASRDVADDVVQEVAARVLAHGVTFADAADLMRWAVPVALNLLVDAARHNVRVEVGIDGWDRAEGDVADVVAHRDRLRRVVGAVARLSDADRAALTDGGAPADRREAVRLAVRRHRARRRLLALVDGVAALTGLLGGLGAWLRRWRPSRVAVAAVPVAFVLPVALVLVQPVPQERRIDVAAAPGQAALVSPAGPAAAPRAATRPRAARRVAAAHPARRVAAAVPARPAPVPTKDVVNVGPRGREVRVIQRPRTAEDRLFCMDQPLPVVGMPCVG
ncbi:MAG TPA: hypothetical protein VF519_08490 [Mycobacteriales bacterium]